MAKLTRTFIGLPIPEPTGKKLAALQEKLAGIVAGVRWTASGDLHATLSFVGDVADVDLNQVCKAVGDVARSFESFDVVVSRVGAFPDLKRPRVICIGLTDEENRLVGIHGELARVLADLGYRASDPKFHPHVTLGRIGNDRGPAPDLSGTVGAYGSWSAGSFQARELVAYASIPGSRGPTYSPLSRIPLKKRMKDPKA